MFKKKNTLELHNVSVHIQNNILLDAVNLTIRPGEVVSILGPNGAGKSTLMKTITHEQALSTGNIILNGRHHWRREDKALMLAVLPQSSSLNFPFTVEETVLLGRTPCSSSRAHNRLVMCQALKKVDCWDLRARLYTTLSAGEKQRVHLARVLSQLWDDSSLGSRYLLLDEPTSALDPAHQQQVLQIARAQADAGMGILIILHDLNLASRYSDRIVILNQGAIAVQGTPYEVLIPDNLLSIFSIEVHVLEHPSKSCPLIINV
ncbi:MAG: heme ABC transporter ATP-binding protein [Endozoicomonas sp. (ex Botrylloides leachii)]|nr:heme ABC transporter ATP-binding protein [Endozoicomonas sp. (ex Botrylloides leachii)]